MLSMLLGSRVIQSTTTRSHVCFRVMSTASALTLHKFFVYAPDRTDEGAIARRFAVRPRHLEAVAPLIRSGIIKVGGMTLTPESIDTDSEKKTPLGSLMIYQAASIKDVRKMVESDVYYTSGVWDAEKILILPFIPVTPFP